MMSSRKQDRAIGPLPPALSSMWRLCKLGYRHEPKLMVVSFGLSQLAALPDALIALWLMLLGKAVLEHRSGLLTGAAIGLAVSAAGTWFLRTVSTRVQRRFRDKVTIALESHVASLQATVATIAHQERPEYLDLAFHVAEPGVRVGPHVHVGVFDDGLDLAFGGDDGAAGVDSSGVVVADGVCGADGFDIDMAA